MFSSWKYQTMHNEKVLVVLTQEEDTTPSIMIVIVKFYPVIPQMWYIFSHVVNVKFNMLEKRVNQGSPQ